MATVTSWTAAAIQAAMDIKADLVSGTVPDSQLDSTIVRHVDLAVKADLVSGKVPDSQMPVDAFMQGDLVIDVKTAGALGNGTADDTTIIQATLNAAPPGSTVFMSPGTYVISAPLKIPPQIRLLGSHGGHIDDVNGSVIKPKSTFTGAAVILLVDQTTGGYSIPSMEQRLEQLSIDGSNLTGSTIDGIQAQGLVHGVYMTDVQIRHVPNHGFTASANGSGTPYSWHCSRLHVSASGGIGINAAMTDSTWIDCEVIGALNHGWFAGGCGNSTFIGCRSEWSAGDGFNIASGTGTGSGSGGPIFIGCTTDRNTHNGVNITSAANGNAPVTFTGCNFRRDGSSSASAGYAGIQVSGSTQPIIVTGCSSYPGTNDDGTGTASPQYGLVASSALVQINGGLWHAITEGIHDGGSNTLLSRSPNVMERTGPTTAPVTVTRGVQTYGSAGDSLDVPAYLAGIQHPRLYGYAGWTYPPDNATSGKAGIAGTLYLAGFSIPRPVTITKLAWGNNTAGVAPVTNENWIGLYSASGAKLAGVNVDARVTTPGAWKETVTAVALSPGTYWVAYLFNATTMPQPFRLGDVSAGLMNLGLSASTLKYAINGTGLTALPSSITPGSNVSAQFSYWGAVAES
jgi:hypothetical protein